MKDIGNVAAQFSALGDPTKNVTVTNWPAEPEPKIVTVCQNCTITYDPNIGDTYALPSVSVVGYHYYSVFVAFYRQGGSAAYLSVRPGCSNMKTANVNTGIQLPPGLSWQSDGITGLSITAPDVCLTVTMGDRKIEVTVVLYCYS
jgi:hypothetical protein